MKCRSLWHSPAKAVRSSTSRAFGFSSATSSMVSGWFGACRTAAFMAGSPFVRSVASPTCSIPQRCVQSR